jgi:hypothetical protein
MDPHTTNISELPIDRVPINEELPEQEMNSHHSNEHIMDATIPIQQQKQVHFNNEIQQHDTTTKMNITITHKIIILATLLFIIFNETYIKNYIMNILVVIFGKYLKENSGVSKSGIIFYGLTYGLVLYIVTLVIDIESLF